MKKFMHFSKCLLLLLLTISINWEAGAQAQKQGDLGIIPTAIAPEVTWQIGNWGPYTTGNVGIGVYDAQYALDIDGSFNITGDSYLPKLFTENLILGFGYGEGQGISFDNNLGIEIRNDGPQMLIGHSGVRIGDNQYPQHTLDVAGMVNAEGFLINGQPLTTGGSNHFDPGGNFIPPGQIVVQNGVDGGRSKGLYMWHAGHTQWGIYMASSGWGRSLNGTAAPTGAGFYSHAIRLRTNNHSSNGVIFENSSDQLNFSVRSNDGMGYFRGALGVGATPDGSAQLLVKGAIKTFNSYSNAPWDNITMWSDGETGYIEANGDEQGLIIRSNTGNRIMLHDRVGVGYHVPQNHLDVAHGQRTGNHPGNRPLYVTGLVGAEDGGVEFRHSNGTQGIGFGYQSIYATGSNDSQDIKIKSRGAGRVVLDPQQGRVDVLGTLNAQELQINGQLVNMPDLDSEVVKIGMRAGEGVTEPGRHVFIGSYAGLQSHFDQTPVHTKSRNDLLRDHAVFVLNNHDNLDQPLLFGKFADYDATGYRPNTLAQIGINTAHLVDSAALTVSGAVHISSKQIDPDIFPHDTLYDDALLHVEKGVLSENFLFANVESWSDHVFEADYELMPIHEVASFIKAHGHLPKVPSEQEIKASGYKQHEINTILLEKIEELTLHLIRLQEALDRQRNAEPSTKP